ncbi:thiamine pyrophosphate-dependent dehydrogenase E1 component subunit alpha [Kocuria sp. HSID16901]|uniref:thiamine pyrophosphate-dependent dehydrogenase E1 component subunit alpha n=1 Tax=Kocuria sp. HSID16901 TaxID=2419505 RepID=UPI000661779F|nr:thiamine pyrophosphate-dependent dehydrogenase E1 component subunit alpha [Kocuria sp. HSID16901]MCT1368295.1 thiamine pyrophosphate-dependent dehydrogenase E1 component subunit alpha [Rothia sp. p3-SID1597]RUQ23203.1 thiamine pyrophosphate-dependent dehydrogenase E1 component subunit alpha [Kocuria sp. HSID16901]
METAETHHPGATEGRLSRVTILDENGHRGTNPTFDPYIKDVTLEDLQRSYRQMLMVRRFDDEATSLQRQGKLALWVPSKGQEAAQIGSANAIPERDYIFPSYREHALAYARGVDLGDLLKVFRGFAPGGWDPQEYRFHLYSFVLASQIPHAVGYAMGQKLDAALRGGPSDEATVVYFGDGASTEGEAHESMVFAASYDAPVLFFIQNNQWAISVPFSTQSRVPLAERAAGYGFEGIRVDGNDLLGVQAATAYAMDKIHRGEGPVLIEAETYRIGAHTTADDPTKYRTADEEAEWTAKDPLVRLEKYLRDQGTSEDFFDTVNAEAKQYGATIRDAVLAMEPPEFDSVFEHVYAEENSLVAQERAWFRDYESGFEEAGTAEGGR